MSNFGDVNMIQRLLRGLQALPLFGSSSIGLSFAGIPMVLNFPRLVAIKSVRVSLSLVC